ncbi:MAG TPA: hypothetical protein PK275_10545 [Chitinophagaceae bacterium]|nr:hypothetical protein [Chitinophagaceae bacterium]
MSVESNHYVLTLKNEKRKLYNRIGFFLLIGLVLAIGFRRYAANEYQLRLNVFYVPFALIIFLFLFFYYRKTVHRFGLEVFFVICFSISIFQSEYVIAGLSLLFFLLYLLSVKTKLLCIGDDHILYPSFPKRKIKWHELNNIVLKDGLLSLDFKNNKIIQQLLEENETAIDENEFNQFCREFII